MTLPHDARRDAVNDAPRTPSRAGLRGWIASLAGLSEPPRRTAAAFAVGVFLSFSPLFGIQIAIGLAAAIALRLNRVAVFVGLCTNLPWLMVPWYALTTAAGAALLGVPVSSDFAARIRHVFELPLYSREFWARLSHLVWPFLGSFLLGSTIGAALLGGIAYFSAARVITRIRAGQDSR